MGLGASATYYQGAGIVTKFDISGTFDGMVESSVAVESAGPLTVLTV
jgi:predicted secreted protein